MRPNLVGYTSGRGWSKILGPARYEEPPKCQFLFFSMASKTPNALHNHLDINQYIHIIEISYLCQNGVKIWLLHKISKFLKKSEFSMFPHSRG